MDNGAPPDYRVLTEQENKELVQLGSRNQLLREQLAHATTEKDLHTKLADAAKREIGLLSREFAAVQVQFAKLNQSLGIQDPKKDLKEVDGRVFVRVQKEEKDARAEGKS